MNSIAEVKLYSNFSLVLYANDILMYNLSIDFQHDLQHISDYIQLNGLKTNHAKTQFLPKSAPKLSISLNGGNNQPCSEVKYQGVTLYLTLLVRAFSNVTKSTNRLLGHIHRSYRCALPLVLTYRSNVLDYCSKVWDPHHLKHINQLKKVQHFATRIISQDGPANSTKHNL